MTCSSKPSRCIGASRNAVLLGIFVLDAGAARDATDRRKDTFSNAHRAFRLFTGRTDPKGRDEQYERLHIGLMTATPFRSVLELYPAGKPDETLTLDQVLDEAVELIVERNFDFYHSLDGRLIRT